MMRGLQVFIITVLLPSAVLAGLLDTVSKLVSSLSLTKPFRSQNSADESLESFIHSDSDVESAHANPAPPPFLTIKFGTKDSPVAPDQYKDYGTKYAEHPAMGISWGWNCDLHELSSTRERNVGDKYLRSFIIPDRHGQCKVTEPTWSIALPAGEYTVKISSSDTDPKTSGLNSDGSGCFVQGIKLGELPAENSCAAGEDSACRVLPRVVVEDGKPLQISGAFAQGCNAVNYISFYEASNETALALSTFKPLKANEVDEETLKAEQELNEFLLSVADDRKNVIATSVNAGYIDFAANWLCSISKMDIDNFFFIATDSESYEYMVSHGHRAYQVHTHEGNEGHKGAADYGTVQYQELILQRTILVNKILKLGFNVLLCDIDAVWLKSPLPYLSSGCDIIAQPEADGRLCGGFMYLRATKGVQKLWQDVTDKHLDIVTEAKKVHHLRSVDESEQELLLKLLPKSGLKVHKLDSDLFPHGLKYFGSQMSFSSQMSSSARKKVVVVHNNYVIGKSKKMQRFQHFGLWFVGDKSSDFQCHRK